MLKLNKIYLQLFLITFNSTSQKLKIKSKILPNVEVIVSIHLS